MTPGQAARHILGTHAKPVGEIYRRIFVDFGRVVDAFAHSLPRGAHCLDIGGGDGMGTNFLLDRRPDLTVTMIDVAGQVGAFLEERHKSRVSIMPSTSIADYAKLGIACGGVIVTDVVHHVPIEMRHQFFADLAQCVDDIGCETLVIKEVGPGRFRSQLSLLSDWYVTGDRHVRLLAPSDLDAHVRAKVAPERIVNMAHLTPDEPNYCLIYHLAKA